MSDEAQLPVDKLIKQLGADDPNARARAQEELTRRAKSDQGVMDAIGRSRSSDPQVRFLIRAVLWGIIQERHSDRMLAIHFNIVEDASDDMLIDVRGEFESEAHWREREKYRAEIKRDSAEARRDLAEAETDDTEAMGDDVKPPTDDTDENAGRQERKKKRDERAKARAERHEKRVTRRLERNAALDKSK